MGSASRLGRRSYTQEEKKEILDTVGRRIAAGEKKLDVLASMHIPRNTFYQWTRGRGIAAASDEIRRSVHKKVKQKPKRNGAASVNQKPRPMTIIPAWSFADNRKYLCALMHDGQSALLFPADEIEAALGVLRQLQ